jgi:hypothetical protein
MVPIRIDKGMRLIMYALIYDEFDPTKREKKIVSVHKTRKTAEKVQAKRRKKPGLGFLEDHTRIVWVEDRVRQTYSRFLSKTIFSSFGWLVI